MKIKIKPNTRRTRIKTVNPARWWWCERVEGRGASDAVPDIREAAGHHSVSLILDARALLAFPVYHTHYLAPTKHFDLNSDWY